MDSNLSKQILGKDVWHVFVIGNPIMAVVARMLIDQLALPDDRLVVFNLRNQDTSLVSPSSTPLRQSFSDRVISKLFGHTMLGRRLTREVQKLPGQFIVYANWLTPEIEELTKSKTCIGHAYLEEGQLSHYTIPPYPVDPTLTIKKRMQQIALGREKRYRDDALAYIGILPDSFPLADANRRVLLSNFESAMAKYEPCLIGIKTIGILPAPHRISENHLEGCLDLLIAKLQGNGALKMHPGYQSYPGHCQRVNEILRAQGNPLIKLCDFSTILELEMMHEQKVIHGPRSSVSKYAEFFGSQFQIIDLPGYIAPIN